jgi:enterochelin esterase-like enzyme
LGADSLPQPGVPDGSIRPLALPQGRVFPGVTHNVWLYLPANYGKKSTLALMIFFDGASFIKPGGAWRVPTVMDNLIAERLIPPMAAVFVNPGATRSRSRDTIFSW